MTKVRRIRTSGVSFSSKPPTSAWTGSRRAIGVLLAALLIAVLAAACGEGPASPGVASIGSTTKTTATGAAPAGYSGTSMSVQLQYAKCMQTHGVPSFPDPGAGAVAAMRKVNFGVPQFQVAEKACRADLPDGGATPSTPLPPKVLAEALKFTQCMRRHGVPNWPDPTSTYYVAPPSDSSVNSPTEVKAAKACEGLLPKE
jgi:hypothetical protein